MIKRYCFLLLLFCSFSFAQFKKITDFTYKNNISDCCDACIYFKIKDDFYEIDESKNILKNGKIIYKCDIGYLLNFAVYKKKYLVVTYHDVEDAKSALGFEYRGIVKLTTISTVNSNLINNYVCRKIFSLFQIKEINSNGQLVIEKTVDPDRADISGNASD